jgi:hypothetical protein
MQQNWSEDRSGSDPFPMASASSKVKNRTLGRIVEHCYADLKRRRIHVRNIDKRLKRTNVDPGLAVMIHFMRAIQKRIQPLNNFN